MYFPRKHVCFFYKYPALAGGRFLFGGRESRYGVIARQTFDRILQVLAGLDALVWFRSLNLNGIVLVANVEPPTSATKAVLSIVCLIVSRNLPETPFQSPSVINLPTFTLAARAAHEDSKRRSDAKASQWFSQSGTVFLPSPARRVRSTMSAILLAASQHGRCGSWRLKQRLEEAEQLPPLQSCESECVTGSTCYGAIR